MLAEAQTPHVSSHLAAIVLWLHFFVLALHQAEPFLSSQSCCGDGGGGGMHASQLAAQIVAMSGSLHLALLTCLLQ